MLNFSSTEEPKCAVSLPKLTNVPPVFIFGLCEPSPPWTIPQHTLLGKEGWVDDYELKTNNVL